MSQLFDVPDFGALPSTAREDSSCASCGGTTNLESRGGVLFCDSCIAWTRQSELDPLYDDLGVGD